MGANISRWQVILPLASRMPKAEDPQGRRSIKGWGLSMRIQGRATTFLVPPEVPSISPDAHGEGME